MWLYQDKEFTEDQSEGYVGFVYLIENHVNGRKYVGKKLFSSVRRKKVKGKTRRKKTVKQSDWLSYYGSNKELLEDVKKYGESNFRRTILHLCRSKGTCNYLETKEIILHGALESDQFYNDWVYVKVHRSHIKI